MSCQQSKDGFHTCEMKDGSYVCTSCAIVICTDCGTTPMHIDNGSYCRRCAEKAGHSHDFYSKIDHDMLRKKYPAIAEEILSSCRSYW